MGYHLAGPFLHCPIDLSDTFAFGNRRALVVLLLAARQPDLDFGFVFLQIQSQRYERQPLFLRPAEQAQYLLAMHQHLAVAVWIDILAARRFVRCDVHIHQPHLTIANLCVTVAQVHAAGPYGFDLGSGQDDARFVSFVDMIVTVRFAIGSQDLADLSHADITCLSSEIGLRDQAVDQPCLRHRRPSTQLEYLA